MLSVSVDFQIVQHIMEFEIWIGADENILNEYRQQAVKKLGSQSVSKRKDVKLVIDEEDEEDETIR